MKKLNFRTNKAEEKLQDNSNHIQSPEKNFIKKIPRIQAVYKEKAAISKAKLSPHKIPKLTLALPIYHKQETEQELEDQNTILQESNKSFLKTGSKTCR